MSDSDDERDPFDHLLQGSDIVPNQIPSVRHGETLQLSFSGGVTVNLILDASPGCGGVAWPAGEVGKANSLELFSRTALGSGSVSRETRPQFSSRQKYLGARRWNRPRRLGCSDVRRDRLLD